MQVSEIHAKPERDNILKHLECIYCDTKFSVEICANFSVICPCCKRSIYLECEYGFGPVTPCQIYLGEKAVGIVESKGTNYYLNMETKNINLSSTNLEAISEAEKIIKEHMKISHPNKTFEILTQGGSLCFYGDWFGRSYDNFHKIIHARYDDKLLEIFFDCHEHLIIYEPQNITNTKHELKIKNAKKVKWMYIPYETATTKHNTIIYTAEGEKISKHTKYGIEYLTPKGSFDAVYLG